MTTALPLQTGISTYWGNMPEPRLDWRVPISDQRPKFNWVAHLLPIATATNKMAKTLCGKPVNPGFAVRAPKAKRCKKCDKLKAKLG